MGIDPGAARAANYIVQYSAAENDKIRAMSSVPLIPEYDAALPISEHREAIVRAIREHQVLIVAGETGSGKTTQIPKMCLEAGRGENGLIACTQPRRIAARAMAERVAEELGEPAGHRFQGLVGYKVRFRDHTAPNNRIRFMTDGILLAELTSQPTLKQYDTVIIDEAHERSLNIDFLLGNLKRLLPRRPDLRVVITSATIDTAKFSRHFDDAPVIEVSGRGYPVDMVYRPLGDGESAIDPQSRDYDGRDLYRGIAEAVRALNRIDARGDILVFLSGEREIREASDFLERQHFRHTEVLPLFARLSASEQHRVFHPGPERRIILSTNIAETSLTVPRIRFVIDSGFARISRYSHRSRIQRLPIEAISQASANQRAGRCGRLGPGTCVRLYSEEDFNSRPEFTEPEILRTSLATVILQMLCMGLGEVEDFPFVDSPAPRMINDAYHLLTELGALDGARSVTEMGRQLVRWPMDVRLARMVIEGARQGCLENIMVLAAAQSIQDPRERPLDKQQQSDEQHARFIDPKSDFAGLLRLWDYLRSQRSKRSGNQFRKMCQREFLNWQRVLEWFDLYQQLRVQAREERLKLSGRKLGEKGVDAPIHKALLAGLLSQVGHRIPESHAYQGARSRQFHIFPGSGLFKGGPQWLMSAEIVETSRPYARLNAAIQPEWIEEQGRHLLKHRVFDPHWSRRAGRVLAWEQVSLYGLVIVEKRRVSFAEQDPQKARELFILHALVRGEMDTRAAFMDKNAQLREDVEKLEHKRRRHDVVADERAQYEFFDARIPPEVNSAKGFERWFSGLSQAQRDTLEMGLDVLLREDAGMAPEEQFPDSFNAQGQAFSLDYHFEPGHEHDGVTMTVPLELLNTLSPGQVAWLVPGLLRDKVIALIKQLPKPLRRALTPAPQFADAVLEAVGPGPQQDFHKALAVQFSRITGQQVAAEVIDETTVEPHLRMRTRVVDDSGQELAEGRDLAALQEKLGASARRRFMDRQGAQHNQDNARDWQFGTLQESVTTDAGVSAWPALVDQGDAVGVRLFDTWEEAWTAHNDGVMRLLALEMPDKLRYLEKHHGISRAGLMAWSSVGSTETLVHDLVQSSLRQAAGDVSAVRDASAFKDLAGRVRNGIGKVCARRARQLSEVLESMAQVRKNNRRFESSLPDAWADMQAQLDDLVYPAFLEELEPERLEHYPRYLAALLYRQEKLRTDPAQDRAKLDRVAPWWKRYQDALERGEEYDQAMDAFRWLIHEFRVSVFAQHLGTDGKVSEKRLGDAWSETSAA